MTKCRRRTCSTPPVFPTPDTFVFWKKARAVIFEDFSSLLTARLSGSLANRPAAVLHDSIWSRFSRHECRSVR
jgi:hypothetical protein